MNKWNEIIVRNECLAYILLAKKLFCNGIYVHRHRTISHIDLSISFTLGLFRQNEGPKKLERKSILKMIKYLEIIENLPKKTECHTAIIVDKRRTKNVFKAEKCYGIGNRKPDE